MMINPKPKLSPLRTRLLFWPLWQWPRLWQWALSALVLLGFAGLGWAWWWQERLAWQALGHSPWSGPLSDASANRPEAGAGDEQGPAMPVAWGGALSLEQLSARSLEKAEQAGLSVSSWVLTPEPAEPAAGLVRRAGISVQLQGPYSSIKAWLTALLSTHPQMVVDRMQWRASELDGAVLDVQINWSVYGQP